MKIIERKIRIIKKEKYVFLSIIASFVIVFFAMNDSFAQKDIPQAVIDDFEITKSKLSDKVKDFTLNKSSSEYFKKNVVLNSNTVTL